VRLCNDHRSTHRANVCLLNIALCQIEQGRLDGAAASMATIRAPGRAVIDRIRGAAAYNAGLLAELRIDFDDARREYQESLAIRQRLGQHALAIDSVAGLLRIAILTGDRPNVFRYAIEIQRHVRSKGSDGIEHLGRMHLALIDADLAVDDRDCARTHTGLALAELAGRAGNLSDPDLRASYLRAVPSHHRLLDVATALGVPAPQPIGDEEPHPD
jgi:hypothetical protein